MNDAQLFRWLEKNPDRVTYCHSYYRTIKSRWYIKGRRGAVKAKSLRDAIKRAAKADAKR